MTKQRTKFLQELIALVQESPEDSIFVMVIRTPSTSDVTVHKLCEFATEDEHGSALATLDIGKNAIFTSIDEDFEDEDFDDVTGSSLRSNPIGLVEAGWGDEEDDEGDDGEDDEEEDDDDSPEDGDEGPSVSVIENLAIDRTPKH